MASLLRKITYLSILVLVLLAWGPWIGEDYAVRKVVEQLGGEDRIINYLGEEMPLRDVPKNPVRVPFGVLVYFPGEAVFFVAFSGGVL